MVWTFSCEDNIKSNWSASPWHCTGLWRIFCHTELELQFVRRARSWFFHKIQRYYYSQHRKRWFTSKLYHSWISGTLQCKRDSTKCFWLSISPITIADDKSNGEFSCELNDAKSSTWKRAIQVQVIGKLEVLLTIRNACPKCSILLSGSCLNALWNWTILILSGRKNFYIIGQIKF